MSVAEKLFSIFYLNKRNQFAVFTQAQEAYLYHQNYRINLITGSKELVGIDFFINYLKGINLEYQSKRGKVIHLFYELGYLFGELELPGDPALAIFIDYSKTKILPYEKLKFLCPKKIKVKLESKISRSEYEKKFEQVYEQLFKGNCYQLNLTYQCDFSWKEDYLPQEWIAKIWKSKKNRAAYAHATYSDILKKLYLSNSPECLFKTNKTQIFSMPIKGSLSLKSLSLKRAWNILSKNKKEQAELYMISDLVRNDLSRVSEFDAHILETKKMLEVPGIVHQYSIVSAKLGVKTNLFQILHSLYPGGSITGAPKKRVMQLISSFENGARGFYCGSTLLLQAHNKSASINIRSATLDFKMKTLRYGCGGGITLQSRSESEYEEANLKLKSFIRLLD